MVTSRNTVYDFMRRTEANLNRIEEHAASDPNTYFEVTQLINSAIGLLMFPSEDILELLPKRRLSEFLKEEPAPKVIYGSYDGEHDPTIAKAIKYVRNGFAHYNVYFANQNNVIKGIYIWNRPSLKSRPDWVAYVSIQQLRELFTVFAKEFKKVTEKLSETDLKSDKLSRLEKELGASIRITNPEGLE